ncbi:zinc finger MYM-type protein 3 isoform X2 [Chironomus tepperi]|uniref:zinc finger MYM-type protein 3 isoform X2 n=1 Tax=Chironomus tepperi TaxID=113505 RepID=UPI00391F1EF2
MDEPQTTNSMDVSDTEKTSFDDLLNDASVSNENEKQMEVDETESFPSTSNAPETLSETSEKPENSEEPGQQPEIEEAGSENDNQNEENAEESTMQTEQDQTLDQSNFDETLQSKQNESEDYTEKSINISQISVDQNDDSNDAFDALKLSESNVLEQTKDTIGDENEPENQENENIENEENEQENSAIENNQNEPESENVDNLNIEKEKEETENTGQDLQNPENEEEDDDDDFRSAGDGEQEQIDQDQEQEGSSKDQETAMETDQQVPESEENLDQTDQNEAPETTDEQSETVEESHSADAATEMTSGELGDDSGTAESSERVEEPEEEETTETTNEGEGMDENVCLFGDAERELTDADKERVVQPQETSEEEESESIAGEKEVTEQEPTTEEAMEVDAEGPQEEEELEQEEIVESAPEEIEDEIADQSVPLNENEIREVVGALSEETCLNCENNVPCQYRLLEDTGEIKYLCSFNCVKEHREDNPDKYSLTQKKVYIYEIPAADFLCSKCNETKSCKYHYRVTIVSSVSKEPQITPPEGEDLPQPVIETVQSTEDKYLCDDKCLQELIGDNTEKYIVKEVQRRSTRVREARKRAPVQEEPEIPKIVARSDAEVEAARIDRDESFIRRCNQCFHVVNFTAKTIQWETLDFCNEKCLGLYQNLIGASCVTCNQAVNLASIGKLCVRFGFDLKQFCSTKCLDDFKKTIKQCALCQNNLYDEENVVIAQVGEKRIYRDFCNQQCLKKYENILNPKKKQSPHVCSVCNNKKIAKIEVLIDENVHCFCSNPCFSAFKFVNNVVPDQCDMCTKYFERKSSESFTIYQITESKIFCNRVCMNMFICKSREIWQCNWCKVSKYNYDMIQMNFGKIRMCSLNCLSLHEVSLNALTPKRTKCSHCKLLKQPQYHLTMSDTSIRSFCTYQCAIGFQGMFSKSKMSEDDPSAVIPAGTAKRIKPSTQAIERAKQQATVPIIARVQSLSTGSTGRRTRLPYNPIGSRSRSPIPVPELTVQLERLSDLPSRVKISSLNGTSSWTPIPTTSRAPTPTRVEHKTQVVTIPPAPTQVSNKSTMCKAISLNKAVSAVPQTAEAECQTDDYLEQKYIIPVPIPIYIPQPMYMYNLPTPIPVPIPLPIPIPVFIPTTRNSSQGIMKEIKKIQDKMPTDPYEAELLMMAEMVAGDRKREETDSDSDENEIEYGDGIENNFNEDLVQMAFKMASGNDYDDPPVDLENEMTASTISQNAGYDDMDPQALHHHQLLLLHQQREAAMQANRGRKRMPPVKQNNTRNTPNKRIKREMESMQPEIPREPAEKPDANMCLKYTFGVNAWKQWVATKNADLEKSSIRRRPIKSEILQLTADELNYSLCMFVKEVRKPNGSEYAPDTIYYLVLGIQQYLYENGRIDNIFTDRYYEQFTDCLDEVAKKFSVLYNDSQYIVTRVEEEHLWECKQLGAHSPHVLLSTLMFFNTKHFNLVTVDEHMELSFSHIMKHWKRNPNQPGAAKMPGSRNVLLRFYPPQSSLANSRKKKVYEQQENEENPLRCPVKLYEFYLSKCPESVKTRNDVFYLQPERSCVPDSPVWYSTQPLSRDALSKMLHRVKMVKEINIALLTS